MILSKGLRLVGDAPPGIGKRDRDTLKHVRTEAGVVRTWTAILRVFAIYLFIVFSVFAQFFFTKMLYLETLRVAKSDFGIGVLTFRAYQGNLWHFSNKVKFMSLGARLINLFIKLELNNFLLRPLLSIDFVQYSGRFLTRLERRTFLPEKWRAWVRVCRAHHRSKSGILVSCVFLS